MTREEVDRTPESDVAAEELTYPITAALRDQLGRDGLTGQGFNATDYIGEYEHGSVDIETLLPDAIKEDVMSDDNDEPVWQMNKTDLIAFAANVLVDYLRAVDAAREDS